MPSTMTRFVLRLPEGLTEKVEQPAEKEDKLPTEWIRDLLRESFKDAKAEAEPAKGEPHG